MSRFPAPCGVIGLFDNMPVLQDTEVTPWAQHSLTQSYLSPCLEYIYSLLLHICLVIMTGVAWQPGSRYL